MPDLRNELTKGSRPRKTKNAHGNGRRIAMNSAAENTNETTTDSRRESQEVESGQGAAAHAESPPDGNRIDKTARLTIRIGPSKWSVAIFFALLIVLTVLAVRLHGGLREAVVFDCDLPLANCASGAVFSDKSGLPVLTALQFRFSWSDPLAKNAAEFADPKTPFCEFDLWFGKERAFSYSMTYEDLEPDSDSDGFYAAKILEPLAEALSGRPSATEATIIFRPNPMAAFRSDGVRISGLRNGGSSCQIFDVRPLSAIPSELSGAEDGRP